MSLKAKLATTLAALCMVICLLTVGVWAASQTTVNMSGTVTFVANDVYATVAVSDNGTAKTSVSKTVTFNSNATEGQVNAGNTETWNNANIEFKDKNTAIVLTFTITNLSKERSLTVAVTDETESKDNYKIEIVETTETKTNGTITAEGSATYTATFTILDKNEKVDAEGYALKVLLTDQLHVAG